MARRLDQGGAIDQWGALFLRKNRFLPIGEPLSDMDLPSREQIETMLAGTDAALLFAEHDRVFEEKIATRRLEMR